MLLSEVLSVQMQHQAHRQQEADRRDHNHGNPHEQSVVFVVSVLDEDSVCNHVEGELEAYPSDEDAKDPEQLARLFLESLIEGCNQFSAEND